MRISDWSSDVCSSDLVKPRLGLRDVHLFRSAAIMKARTNSNHSCPMTSKTTIGEREKGSAMQESIRQHSCRLAPRHGLSGYTETGRSWMARSEEHTSELQSLMRISYAVFCLKKKT